MADFFGGGAGMGAPQVAQLAQALVAALGIPGVGGVPAPAGGAGAPGPAVHQVVQGSEAACVAAAQVLENFSAGLGDLGGPGVQPHADQLRASVADMLAPFAVWPALGSRPSVVALARWARCQGIDASGWQGRLFGAMAPRIGAAPPESLALASLELKANVTALISDLRGMGLLEPGLAGAGGPGGGPGAAAAAAVPQAAGLAHRLGGGAAAAEELRELPTEQTVDDVLYYRLPGATEHFPAEGLTSSVVKTASALLASVWDRPVLTLKRMGSPWTALMLEAPGLAEQLVRLARLHNINNPAAMTSLAKGRFPANPMDLLPVSEHVATVDPADALHAALKGFQNYQSVAFSKQDAWSVEIPELVPQWRAALTRFGVATFCKAWKAFHDAVFSVVDPQVDTAIQELGPASSHSTAFVTRARQLRLPSLRDQWNSVHAQYAATAQAHSDSGGLGEERATKRHRADGDAFRRAMASDYCFDFLNHTPCDGRCGYSHVVDPHFWQQWELQQRVARNRAQSAQRGGHVWRGGKKATGTKASTAGSGAGGGGPSAPGGGNTGGGGSGAGGASGGAGASGNAAGGSS